MNRSKRISSCLATKVPSAVPQFPIHEASLVSVLIELGW